MGLLSSCADRPGHQAEPPGWPLTRAIGLTRALTRAHAKCWFGQMQQAQ